MTLSILSSSDFWSLTSEVSYHGVEISATASDLIAVLGEVDRQPDYEKTQFNWFLRLEREDGTEIFATIYDWKEYYDFSLDETLMWHVGAATQYDAEAVAEVLQSLLNPESTPLPLGEGQGVDLLSDSSESATTDLQAHYSKINQYLTYADMFRKEFIDNIKSLLGTECIDFCDDAYISFWDACDRPYTHVYDHCLDCSMDEEIHSIDGERGMVETETDSVSFEDLNIISAMQVYRCLVQFIDWRQTGCIEGVHVPSLTETIEVTVEWDTDGKNVDNLPTVVSVPASVDEDSLPTRLRVVVLLPGDGRIDLIDLECEPDDVIATLQEHYGHSFFQYMAAPCEHWYCRHKYINALDECETIKEFTL